MYSSFVCCNSNNNVKCTEDDVCMLTYTPVMSIKHAVWTNDGFVYDVFALHKWLQTQSETQNSPYWVIPDKNITTINGHDWVMYTAIKIFTYVLHVLRKTVESLVYISYALRCALQSALQSAPRILVSHLLNIPSLTLKTLYSACICFADYDLTLTNYFTYNIHKSQRQYIEHEQYEEPMQPSINETRTELVEQTQIQYIQSLQNLPEEQNSMSYIIEESTKSKTPKTPGFILRLNKEDFLI